MSTESTIAAAVLASLTPITALPVRLWGDQSQIADLPAIVVHLLPALHLDPHAPYCRARLELWALAQLDDDPSHAEADAAAETLAAWGATVAAADIACDGIVPADPGDDNLELAVYSRRLAFDVFFSWAPSAPAPLPTPTPTPS